MILRGRRSAKLWENVFRYGIKCILIPTSSKRHSSSPIENCFPTIWHSSVVWALNEQFWGGGTDLEKGYGDVRPWRPPFLASPVVRKGPISSKRVSSQDPLLRKFWKFYCGLYSLNFCQNFSSQAPKFGNFQLTSPQIWKFSVHKPPNLEIFSSQAPSFRSTWSVRKPHHFGNPGRTPLPV